MKRDKTKYVIVGNSTAAIGAVEGIRRLDRQTPIVLISKEPYHTYSRPLISYLLAGEVDKERMYYRPRDFYERNAVDARLGVEAVRVDADALAVETADGGRIPFEKLLVATGGRPFVPKIAGSDAEGVFTFVSWDDAKAISTYIGRTAPERTAVVGGGLIGIKAAEALHACGLDVTVVELADRLLPLALDAKGSELAAAALRDAGVKLVCGTTVERILASDGAVSDVVLRGGRTLTCELVVIAIGVVPDTSIVEGSRIETDRGIRIDEHCATSVPGIYAAGDVAQGSDTLTGNSRPIPIFPNACRQGNVAGTNMAGGEARMGAAFAMNSVEVFGLPTISVGLATAEGEGYEVLVRGQDSARAYRRFVLRDGRLVGALFVGDIDRAGIVTGLIRERIDASGIKDLLLSDGLGLISLPAEYRKHVVRGDGIVV